MPLLPVMTRRLRVVVTFLFFGLQAVVQALPLPPGDPSTATWPTDKAVHLFLGAVGVALLRWAGAGRAALPIAVGAASAFEGMQAALPARSPELLDWLFATSGASLAAAGRIRSHRRDLLRRSSARRSSPTSDRVVASALLEGDAAGGPERSTSFLDKVRRRPPR